MYPSIRVGESGKTVNSISSGMTNSVERCQVDCVTTLVQTGAQGHPIFDFPSDASLLTPDPWTRFGCPRCCTVVSIAITRFMRFGVLRQLSAFSGCRLDVLFFP